LKESVDDLTENPPVNVQHFRRVYENALDLFGEFTGKEQLREFRQMAWNLYKDIKDDKEANAWFNSLRREVESALEHPETLTTERKKRELEELTERGARILQNEKWKEQFRLLITKFRELLENIKRDSTTQEFLHKLEKFGKDILFNEQGLPDLFVLEDSVGQLKNLVVPLFKTLLERIPIKRIDVCSEHYDVRVEDIVFDAATFLPEHLDFKLLNASHLDFKDSRRDISRHQLLLQVDNIKPKFHHLKFYYKRKTFPHIEDYGLADLQLAGEGLMFRILWTVESKGNIRPVARLSDVTCHIDKLNIHIIGEATKHNILDAMIAPIVAGMLKNKISNMLQDYMEVKLEEINLKINRFLASHPGERLTMKADQALKQAYQQAQAK